MQKRSIALSDELISRIEQYAIEERRKFSPTVAILIEKALKEIERNRNRKRGTGSRKFTPNQGLKEVVLKKEGEKDPSESLMEVIRSKPFLAPAELKEIQEKYLGITTVEFPEYHPELNIQSTGGIKTENR